MLDDTSKFQIVAGTEVVAAMNAHRDATVKPGCYAGTFDSSTLCLHQSEMSRRGYVGLEILQFASGCSIRYDSGLQNFGLFCSSRSFDGTFETAVSIVTKWAEADPSRRYAWTRRK